MQGLMQDWPLTVDRILDHAARWHGGREVVTRSIEGPIMRTTWGEIHGRAKRLSNALLGLGIRPGERVATLAWNSGRHIEAWYAIMGIGAVCHTLNPRLFADQLCYIINHAQDRTIFTDETFLPLLMERRADMPSVERLIVLADPDRRKRQGIDWRALLGSISSTRTDPIAPGAGSTSRPRAGCATPRARREIPKGVLYSHRSNFLHTLVTLQQRRDGPVGAGHRPGRGADVPRQRLGFDVLLPGGRRQADHAGAEDGRRLDP